MAFVACRALSWTGSGRERYGTCLSMPCPRDPFSSRATPISAELTCSDPFAPLLPGSSVSWPFQPFGAPTPLPSCHPVTPPNPFAIGHPRLQNIQLLECSTDILQFGCLQGQQTPQAIVGCIGQVANDPIKVLTDSCQGILKDMYVCYDSVKVPTLP